MLSREETDALNTIRNTLISRRQNCTLCLEFDKDNELCTKAKPHTRPPAKVLVVGCPAFDDIPF